MKKNLLFLCVVAAGLSSAASVTNLSVTNLSDPDFYVSGPNGQVEFRSAITSTSGPVKTGLFTSMGAHLSWLLAGRSPEGVAAADYTSVRIGYEISFTVLDPANAGYLLSASAALRGWNTGLWSFGDTGQLGGGTGGFSVDASQDGTYVAVPALTLTGGGVTVDEATPEDNTLVAESANTLGVYFATGTRSFSLRLLAPLSFVGTSGPAGEAALRYGLQPTSSVFSIAGTPGSDEEEASLLGLNAEIALLSFDGGDVTAVPEPGQALLMAFPLSAMLLLGAARRRR